MLPVEETDAEKATLPLARHRTISASSVHSDDTPVLLPAGTTTTTAHHRTTVAPGGQ